MRTARKIVKSRHRKPKTKRGRRKKMGCTKCASCSGKTRRMRKSLY